MTCIKLVLQRWLGRLILAAMEDVVRDVAQDLTVMEATPKKPKWFHEPQAPANGPCVDHLH